MRIHLLVPAGVLSGTLALKNFAKSSSVIPKAFAASADIVRNSCYSVLLLSTINHFRKTTLSITKFVMLNN